MNSTSAPTLAVFFTAGMIVGMAATAQDATHDFGGVARHVPTRSVTIDANTRYIDVTQAEQITIRNRSGASFSWKFDTRYAPPGFPVARIAPADFDAGNTWVYVRPNGTQALD